jgi:hypothetical protein
MCTVGLDRSQNLDKQQAHRHRIEPVLTIPIQLNWPVSVVNKPTDFQRLPPGSIEQRPRTRSQIRIKLTEADLQPRPRTADQSRRIIEHRPMTRRRNALPDEDDQYDRRESTWRLVCH